MSGVPRFRIPDLDSKLDNNFSVRSYFLGIYNSSGRRGRAQYMLVRTKKKVIYFKNIWYSQPVNHSFEIRLWNLSKNPSVTHDGWHMDWFIAWSVQSFIRAYSALYGNKESRKERGPMKCHSLGSRQAKCQKEIRPGGWRSPTIS